MLDYDPATGVFLWKNPAHQRLAGLQAGCTTKRGYLVISIDDRSYLAHRLAWFYVYKRWPKPSADHINRVRGDNRIDNLRQASAYQQTINSKLNSRNKTGYRGVRFDPKSSKFRPWIAQIQAHGKQSFLGTFPTAEQAHLAYVQESKKLFGEFVGQLSLAVP